MVAGLSIVSAEAGIGLMILGAIAYPVIAWVIIRAHELEKVDDEEDR
jgi:Trk-type K+ transport system membrane component